MAALAIRVGTPDDIPAIAGVVSRAFADHARRMGTPMPLGDPATAQKVVARRFAKAGFYCALAERDGKAVGVNFLDERNPISGVTTLAVDPDAQDRSLGKALVETVLERAKSRETPGVRLVTAAGNPKSLALYSKAGFRVRITMAVMVGRPQAAVPEHMTVRSAEAGDLDPCNRLCTAVHGHHRFGELKDGIASGIAMVVTRDGRVTGYTSALGSAGHSVGETNEDLMALISGVERFSGRGPIVPTQNYQLLRWCLDHGMTVQHQVMLMTVGLYSDPSEGAYLPSMTY